MIGIIFQRLDQVVEVRVNGKDIMVRDNQMSSFVPFVNLRLDKSGVIKEFPDLENNDNWRSEAITRFKDKISLMKDEEEIKEYIIEELTKVGYVALYQQRQGHRVEKIS